jgi:nucleoside-diphosphate-sugar epimerase
MNSPNVLVTGSSGHQGCALMLSLASYGFSPIGIDILPSATTTHVGSVSDRAFVTRIFSENPSLRHVIHAATLHKPHVGSHTKEEFVQTNITGTLVLLEEASRHPHPIESFIFISTTSTFGSALSPKKGQPAIWINESVVPIPKNIYGVTKVAAEDMCFLIHRQAQLPVLVLRTSRFFPEQDDEEERRNGYADDNLKVCELAYRRVDIADVVSACVCAMKRAKEIGWGKYIISEPPPFTNDPETLRRLDSNAGDVMKEIVPASIEVFKQRGWKFLDRLDRVYDSSKAVRELGWEPQYTFEKAIAKLAAGEEWRSELRARVGMKGYHAVPTGVYTV